MGSREFGFERDGPPIAADRLLRPAGGMVRVAEVQMGVRVVGERAHRPADEFDRLLWIAAGSRDDPEHVQGVGVVGRLVKNAPVELRGAAEPSGAVMGERRIEVGGESRPWIPEVRRQPRRL